MIMIEMREAAKDRAFNLLDEIKDLGRQKKMALCELEDTLYDCFESSGEDEYEDTEKYEPVYDMRMRRRANMRYNRHYAMRDDVHHDIDDDDDEYTAHSYRRRNMRMRRNRMGRFV